MVMVVMGQEPKKDQESQDDGDAVQCLHFAFVTF